MSLKILLLVLMFGCSVSNDKIIDIQTLPSKSKIKGERIAELWDFTFNGIHELNSENYEEVRLKLENKASTKARHMDILDSAEPFYLYEENRYQNLLTEKFIEIINLRSYEEFSEELDNIIPWVYKNIPVEFQEPLFDRIAILKYSMVSLYEKVGDHSKENSTSRINYGCDFGCEHEPLQQYQLDNTLTLMKNAPDGCYPVFDRSDCFIVKSQSHELVIKHCPKGYKYDKNCGCESVSWWDSWGRCAAAILAGAGAGAVGGGGALSVTVYGIPVGITVGAIAGGLGGAAAGCWVPE